MVYARHLKCRLGNRLRVRIPPRPPNTHISTLPMERGTRRDFLKHMRDTAIAGAVILSGASTKAEEPPSQERREEKKELPIPKLILRDQTGNGFGYRNTRDRLGNKIADRPDEGELVYYRQSLEGKKTTVERKVVHELIHQQWDHLTVTEQETLIDTLEKTFGNRAEKFIRDQDPTYDLEIEQLAKAGKEKEKRQYMMNEFVAHTLAYTEVPVPKPGSVKELFKKEVWDEAVKDAGSEEALLKQIAENPDYIPDPSISDFYDTNEVTFFDIQKQGLVLTDELQKQLKILGIGNNGNRAKIVLATIRVSAPMPENGKKYD